MTHVHKREEQKPDGKRRNTILLLRLHDYEKACIADIAKKRGISMARLVMERIFISD